MKTDFFLPTVVFLTTFIANWFYSLVIYISVANIHCDLFFCRKYWLPFVFLSEISILICFPFENIDCHLFSFENIERHLFFFQKKKTTFDASEIFYCFSFLWLLAKDSQRNDTLAIEQISNFWLGVVVLENTEFKREILIWIRFLNANKWICGERIDFSSFFFR